MTEVEVVDEGKSLEQDLKEKVGVGAQYMSSFFGSAWSKAAEGAAFFSFATGPDDEEEETVDPKDLPPEKESNHPEGEEEEEEEEDLDPLSSLITAAMCKVGLTKSTSSKDGQLKESESSYSLVDSAYSVFEKAKKTLEDNIYTNEHHSIFEIDKEQEEIVKRNQEKQRLRNYYKGMYPWLGYEKESELKDKIMALSSDKRNFLFDPPSGVTFDFDYGQATGVAEGLLAQDENLQLMRYRIVPKLKNEETFWRNYFYRVSLIQQCYELKSVEEYVANEQPNVPKIEKGVKSKDASLEDLPGDDEFVSDSFQASSKDMDEAAENVKKLSKSTEDEIEAELENELQEYEVVKDEADVEWENQLEEMLDS